MVLVTTASTPTLSPSARLVKGFGERRNVFKCSVNRAFGTTLKTWNKFYWIDHTVYGALGRTRITGNHRQSADLSLSFEVT
jgi:hypothetical protein